MSFYFFILLFIIDVFYLWSGKDLFWLLFPLTMPETSETSACYHSKNYSEQLQKNLPGISVQF